MCSYKYSTITSATKHITRIQNLLLTMSCQYRNYLMYNSGPVNMDGGIHYNMSQISQSSPNVIKWLIHKRRWRRVINQGRQSIKNDMCRKWEHSSMTESIHTQLLFVVESRHCFAGFQLRTRVKSMTVHVISCHVIMIFCYIRRCIVISQGPFSC